MTPGQHQKHSVAGALALATGTRHHCVGPRNTNALFRDRLGLPAVNDPAERDTRVDVVVENYQSHKAVEQWRAAHPRVTRLLWPAYGPQANPIERAFGDVHDLCTRNQTRHRWRDLVADVEEPLHVNGPWQYKLADLDDAPAVTAAVEHMTDEGPSKFAA